ncbi:hypothetical protein [Streptomyces sedi]|uniref:Uncharacterized protein n=1 Tax=Streptomyces sedi TaxID=555059 RepID=A0A5C4UQL3_9ACTN|nr:hypothetical protein [Streptomyces sedi]TNM25900.1 hypothetical protein FH715_25365 [Streptomyces sedi]
MSTHPDPDLEKPAQEPEGRHPHDETLADCFLGAVDERLAREAEFRVPVALIAEVYGDRVA